QRQQSNWYILLRLEALESRVPGYYETAVAKAEPKSEKKIEDVLRQPAEILFAHELEALACVDKGDKPEGWLLSPKAVETYILGGKAGDTPITAKYVGSQRLVQIAIASLATDRALLLIGERSEEHTSEL